MKTSAMQDALKSHRKKTDNFQPGAEKQIHAHFASKCCIKDNLFIFGNDLFRDFFKSMTNWCFAEKGWKAIK